MRKMGICLKHKLLVTLSSKENFCKESKNKHKDFICLECGEVIEDSDSQVQSYADILYINRCSKYEMEVYLLDKIKMLYVILKFDLKYNDKEVKEILDRIYNRKDVEDIVQYRRSLNRKDAHKIIEEAIKRI